MQAPQTDSARRGGLGTILGLGRYILASSARSVSFSLLFMVFASLTDGISVLLLVPLLKLIDPARSTGSINLPTGPAAPWLGPHLSLSLAALLAIFVVMVTARGALTRYKDLYTAAMVQDFLNRLRNQVFASVAHARWGYLSRLRSSDLNHVLTADIDRVNIAVIQLLQLIQTCVITAIYGIVALLVSPTLSLLAAGVGIVALAVLAPIRRLAVRYGATLTGQRQEQYRIVSEFLAGLKFAKSAKTESIYVDQLSTTLGAMRKNTLGFMRVYTLGGLFFQVATALGLALFVYVAVMRYHMPYSSIIALVFLFIRLAPRVIAVHGAAQDILTNVPAFDAMLRLRRDCERESEPLEDAALIAPIARREVAFQRVVFAYDGEASRAVLDDVSFTIPVDKITAIIGPSGSGKSTIADLIIGLLEPTSGAVVVDGTPLRPGQRRAWRNHLAYVPQDAFLLHDTIAANLAFGQAGLDEAAMWEALRAANADGFVRALPGGLSTIVGDRGLRLSGGERQRIALARALLRKPKLLLLDEATSALDWQSQALIASAIQGLRGRVTVVTIAHRPSMIAFADWVIAIEAGRIVEVGPYAQLAKEDGSHLQRLLAGDREPSPGA